MTRSRSIIIYIILFIFSCVGHTQDNNPFEIKSRVNKSQAVQNKANVFDIKNNTIDTNTLIEIKTSTNNPFEIDKSPKSNSAKYTSPKNNKPQNNTSNTNNSDFLLWLFLFILVFIAILLSINRNLILKIIKVVWYYNHTNSLLRSFGNRELLFYIFLFIVFLLNLSIFTYLFIEDNHNIAGLGFFIKTLGVISSIYIIKHGAIVLMQSIFPSLKGVIMYNFTVFLFNISLGLLLIPINLIIAYSFSSISSFFIILGIVIIAILYTIRLLRGFLVTYNYFSISIFHFFIYLCAFEIIPLLFLYKYFISYL